jgi:TonB family protein
MTQTWKQLEGQVVNGKFPLRQYLGGSEHSAVFLTEDPEHGLDKAAIKLVSPGPETGDLLLSHWKEAAKLSHPHLIKLFQMGHCQLGNKGMLYLVMEYAEVNLSQILPRGPFPTDETRETVKLILDALDHLHGKGFVHGHLKPANIMSVDGQLKLSSDGIFRMGHWIGGRGTLGDYDPPEAESGIHSPAGDVWSLGIILVKTLPQGPPVWVRTEEGDPVVPRLLPAPFFDIARNCLRCDPERRETIDEIRARLEPAAPASKPGKAISKRQYLIPAGVVALLLLAIFAGLKLFEHHNAEPKSAQNPVASSTELSKQNGSGRQSSSGTVPRQSSPQISAKKKLPSGGVVQKGVREKVLPDVPKSASDTIRGTIRVSVKVAVDPAGSVTEATLASAGPSRYFANLALQAARKWKFWPAEADGHGSSKECTLIFEFTRTGTNGFPAQAAP